MFYLLAVPSIINANVNGLRDKGPFKCYIMLWEYQISWKKHCEGVWFNNTCITSEWVVVNFPKKALCNTRMAPNVMSCK